MKTQPLTWLLILALLAACSPPGAPQSLAASTATNTVETSATLPAAGAATGSTPLPAETAQERITPAPTAGKTPLTAETLPLFQPVREFIALSLNITIDKVTVISSERVDWPDACLGAVQADLVCLQVITPGYLVFFETPGGQLEAHLDTSGRKFKVLGLPTAEDSLADPQGSGIYGQVLIGPVCAGPVQEGQSCPNHPYQAVITVLDQTNQVVTEFRTDPQGIFRFALPPGAYTLRPESPGKMPHAAEQAVIVPDGEYIMVQITYDSGMR
jgi:hypothetical protein